MRFEAGDRLGPYDIVEPIGAGGMGEVYRAYDSRLQRTVALKILNVGAAVDAERRSRFLQEARAASALHDPHIVSIFDIGEDSGCDYLVLEYVAGQPLDRILSSRRVPLPQALGYAADIAAALAAAHAAGIVHRDIKPGNVIIVPDGQAKVLDFGLAKLIEPMPGEDSETRTQEAALTRSGTIVGTAAYMSPEQAAARPVDHRTDIFSLGIVIYEMAVGKRPFQGKSQVELLHAILKDPAPGVSELDPALPPELDDILEKALAKNPKDRYQHAGDLALDLRRLQSRLESGRFASRRTAVPPRRSARWVLPVAIAAIAVGGALWRLRQMDYFWTNPLADAAISRITDFEGDELDAAISPDGKLVAFLADRDGPIDAWVTQVGSGSFTNLTKGQFPSLLDELAFGLGFAGDGTQVWVRGLGAGNQRGQGLSTIPSLVGAPRRYLEAPVFNVARSPDGLRIAYSAGDRGGDSIFVAEPDGASARRIFRTNPAEHAHYPVWSPDGRYVYFIGGGVRLAQADVWRVPAAGGSAEQITRHAAAVRYPALLDDRTLVYIAPAPDGSGTALYGMDVERRVPHKLSAGVEQYRSVAASVPSPDGRRRLVAAVANPSSHVWSVPITNGVAAEADAQQVALPSVRAGGPRAGPGYLLYLASTGGDSAIWKFKDGTGLELWRPNAGATVSAPAISRDGQQLCFVARKSGRGTLFLMSAEGTNRRALAEGLDV
ncbi:MAG TPA: protein kinase [Bryobacteraceae bacterium]